ncbi:Intracellular proteinase inhibitor [Methanophagales archaeon]|nr:Intracellular proteinase inhibitor [Methanophagales archaeon]
MKGDDKMERFDGYLFSKLHLIGSKSEGPTYFLQQFDYKEYEVIKHAHLWEEDPELHKFLARKVTIEGAMSLNGIVYKNIMKYKPTGVKGEKRLVVDLKLGTDILWVNKMPPGPQPSQPMDLTLMVKWPYRSIWEGLCPSTQMYDFFIEHEGKTIWTWSQGKVFAQVITPVHIPGGDFHEFPEVWKVNPEDIVSEGTYTARAIFIASGQEVSKDFEVKMAH